jgi:hypothetical protein
VGSKTEKLKFHVAPHVANQLNNANGHVTRHDGNVWVVSGFCCLACGFVATAQAQARRPHSHCKGTTTPSLRKDHMGDPISMGLIINLADRTVQGVFDPTRIST